MTLGPTEKASKKTPAFPRLGYTLRDLNGAKIYSPQISNAKGERRVEMGKRKDRMLLGAGAFSNHRSLGDLPHLLSFVGYQVDILVMPEFSGCFDDSGNQRIDPSLVGGVIHSHKLAQRWINRYKEVTQAWILENLEDHPLLGGFSMGGAGALIAYKALPEELQTRVGGLFLAAPALAISAFEGPRGWLKRYLLLPLAASLGLTQKRRTPHVDGILSQDITHLATRPMGANLAICKVVEEAVRSMKPLKNKNPSVLLFDPEKTDQTVSARAGESVRETFSSVTPVVFKDGHWVFATMEGRRGELINLVKTFADRGVAST